jgi:hypothetical protein
MNEPRIHTDNNKINSDKIQSEPCQSASILVYPRLLIFDFASLLKQSS